MLTVWDQECHQQETRDKHQEVLLVRLINMLEKFYRELILKMENQSITTFNIDNLRFH